MENMIAFITGGSSGIGRATAHRMATEGATVVICSRTEANLKKVVDEIHAAGGKASYVVADVTSEKNITLAIEGVAEKFSRIDVLVNNAMTVAWGSIEESDSQTWAANINGSLNSVYYGTKAVLPLMKRQRGGSIINVSSIVALLGAPGMSGYAAAKSGVVGFSRVAALEGAQSNIRVNVVIPGAIATPPTLASVPDSESLHRMESEIPLKRLGSAEEIAATITFLATRDAGYITGSVIVADGGKSCELSVATAPLESLKNI
ncbi:hypothetical protein CBW56_17975 [Denitratisoma oestradiolicum]|nr:hypothetical protein CBW56_17975 [Denitratisoma oestradiolicum]